MYRPLHWECGYSGNLNSHTARSPDLKCQELKLSASQLREELPPPEGTDGQWHAFPLTSLEWGLTYFPLGQTEMIKLEGKSRLDNRNELEVN